MSLRKVASLFHETTQNNTKILASVTCITFAFGITTAYNDANKSKSLYYDDLSNNIRSSAYYHKLSDELIVPLFRKCLSPENAHDMAIYSIQKGLSPKFPSNNSQEYSNSHSNSTFSISLSSKVFGLVFPNCIGLAAGFDKNGVAFDSLQKDIGFGFVEVGSITPKPQPGNPKPRMFRLPSTKEIINRYGFNSVGMEQVEQNLILGLNSREKIRLGINIGKNKDTPQEKAYRDYQKTIQKLGKYADFIVINISCPNMTGLRNLQKSMGALEILLSTVIHERDNITKKVDETRVGAKPLLPVLVKLSPDLTDDEMKNIAKIIQDCNVDGVIISNTTSTRPILSSPGKNEEHKIYQEVGGLSGKSLTQKSTRQISKFYSITNGKIPIIGVGGIFSAQDVWDKMRAGASLVEIYTGMVYEGPSLIHKIKMDLLERMNKEGIENIQDIVGLDHRKDQRDER